jgi:FlaA1/EpsC-like NDP-sugar epimerase
MLFKLKLINKIPRILKQFFFIVCDICICIISVWLALFLRLDQFLPISGNILWAAVISALILITTFYFFGLYKTIFRYSGKAEMLSIFFGVIIYGIFYTTIITILVIDGVPRSVGIIQPLILFFLLSGSRFILRLIIDDNLYNYYFYKKKNAMIYGAGDAGRQLLSALENNREFKVKGFIDDNKKLHNKFMNGIPIFLPNNIDRLIKNKKISHFLIAIPSASRNRRREILTKLKNYNVDVRILPSLTDLVEGKVTVADIKYPELEDLLEREQVKPDSELLKKNIENKTVLVTGAGGSIGSELCRQIIKFNPLKLIMLDINEHNLYKINSELDQIFKKKNIIISNQDTQLIPIISSILDERRIEHVFSFFKPHTIYHTAAYKHVPLVEENIAVGVKNNVIGTINLAKIAIKYSVFNFVFISSDKAVRPTNVMGASKRLSEISLRSIFHNQNLTNKLSIVRFGNVLGSSGSLIPKVKEQIKLGGPITLTHRVAW